MKNNENNVTGDRRYGDVESPRLYENPILERLSRTQPRTIAWVYLPIILTLLYFAISQLTLTRVIVMFCFGIALWTLIEYLIHRFAFHYQPRDSKWEKINPLYYGYYIHHIHHTYPRDKLRLVTPLVVTLPLALVFYGLFWLLFHSYNNAVFAGFLLGYTLYDLLHAFTHISPMQNRVAKFFKTYHMRHHYLVENKCFGVSIPLWDFIFKTYAPAPIKKSKAP